MFIDEHTLLFSTTKKAIQLASGQHIHMLTKSLFFLISISSYADN